MILILLSFLTAILAIFFWYKSLPIYRIGKFPTPPGYFLLGHVPYINTSKKRLPYIHRELLKNGGFARVSIGPKAVLFASDPEFLKWIFNSSIHVRKTDEYKYFKEWLGGGLIGPQWKLHRKYLTPAFHYKLLEHLVNISNDLITTLIEKLDKNVGCAGLDVYPLISSFSLDVVAENIMATPVNVQRNDDSDYKRSIKELCRIVFERGFDVLKMYDFLFKFQSDYQIFTNSVEYIRGCSKEIINHRRKKLGSEQKLFLDILLSTKDENDEFLSDQEIIEQMNTVIFAGHETISSSMSFALYNLAKYPEIQARAVEEQKNLFGSEKNPIITYADVHNMKYLEMVIKESLRLYSGVPVIGRKIQEDSYYDGKLLPKGLSVFLSLYTFHRTPELFPEPEKFDPDRFEKDPNMYVPFSAGHRNCLGKKFAMIELKQAISAILRNFELLPVPGHVLDVNADLTLKSSTGICIQLRRREY